MTMLNNTTSATATAPAITGAAATFFAYDSKQEYPAPTGKRLVTCLYRSKGNGQAARPNQGTFIPDWITPQLVEDNLPRVMEYIVSFLQAQEDEAIKEKHKACSTMLGDSVFTLDNLLEYMSSKGAGARLSGDSIKDWFTASGMQEALGIMYLERTGMQNKADALVEFISKKLQSLASPKTVWTEAEKEKLLPLLEAAEPDTMRDKLIARINGMSAVSENLLDAL